MKLHDLRSNHPPGWVRLLLAAEVLAVSGGLLAYAMFWMPIHARDVRWVHYVLALGIGAVAPVLANLLHGDRPPDSGLRFDNLRASAKDVVPVTLAMAAGIIAVGLWRNEFHWLSWRRFAEIAGTYLVWGFVQQYVLQAFALRRLRQAGLPATTAAIAAATLFGLVHSPNWPLVAVTILGGIVWCWLFLRRPNLITLGLAHATLAVLIYHAWSSLERMTIGRMYLDRIGH